MKTRLAILVALAATAGASVAAEAIDPVVPGNPGAALGPIGAPPVLFPSEQGAFKGLEVAKQLVESYILQNGCGEESFDLKVKTNAAGTGLLTVDNVNLAIQYVSSSYEGRRYAVGGAGTLGGLGVTDVLGVGSYNIGSEMQELTTDWKMASPYSDTPDDFRGTIIKDYWRPFSRLPIPGFCQTPGQIGEVNYFTNACTPVSTVIDYGYQQIQKHGYIAAKWWQQSQAWRQNGVRSGTFWKVARVAPFGDACEITVRLQGNTGVANTANKQGFNQVGVIEVGVNGSESTGPWFKK
jgi:opacity protein-like surface antigen